MFSAETHKTRFKFKIVILIRIEIHNFVQFNRFCMFCRLREHNSKYNNNYNKYSNNNLRLFNLCKYCLPFAHFLNLLWYKADSFNYITKTLFYTYKILLVRHRSAFCLYFVLVHFLGTHVFLFTFCTSSWTRRSTKSFLQEENSSWTF